MHCIVCGACDSSTPVREVHHVMTLAGLRVPGASIRSCKDEGAHKVSA
jgi:hypothetical protein